MSSKYDLTAAMKHVRGEMHAFTSPNDAVLKIFMPLLGTSDRQFVGAHAAGLEGFVRPAGEIRNTEYAKVRRISWRAEWAALGNLGGHTDCNRAAFVRSVVAPLLVSVQTPSVLNRCRSEQLGDPRAPDSEPGPNRPTVMLVSGNSIYLM